MGVGPRLGKPRLRSAPSRRFALSHRAGAAPLDSFRQIQMEMRGIAFRHLLRGAPRMMNGVSAAFVGRPFARGLRAGIGVALAKRWPPFRLESLLPYFGIRRTDGKSGNTAFVFDNERELRFEQRVRHGIDMADQLAVLVQVRGVSTQMAGRKRDRIERFEVLGSERSDGAHRNVHRTTARSKRLRLP